MANADSPSARRRKWVTGACVVGVLVLFNGYFVLGAAVELLAGKYHHQVTCQVVDAQVVRLSAKVSGHGVDVATADCGRLSIVRPGASGMSAEELAATLDAGSGRRGVFEVGDLQYPGDQVFTHRFVGFEK